MKFSSSGNVGPVQEDGKTSSVEERNEKSSSVAAVDDSIKNVTNDTDHADTTKANNKSAVHKSSPTDNNVRIGPENTKLDMVLRNIDFIACKNGVCVC